MSKIANASKALYANKSTNLILIAHHDFVHICSETSARYDNLIAKQFKILNFE